MRCIKIATSAAPTTPALPRHDAACPAHSRSTTRSTSMKRMKTVLSLALLSASMAIGYQVYAHCGHCAEDGKKIAAQLDKNKFTLAKAVTAAEAHSQGRSISVISDLSDKGEAGVHVYCMKGDKIVL